MTFAELPPCAAWIHRGERSGLETARIVCRPDGLEVEGVTVATEDGDSWQVDGCVDVDLGSSALTNAFPVRRLGLRTGDAADAPAVYVRAPDLVVDRLDQRYRRLPDEGHAVRYAYEAPRFGFACTIRYDETGLVLDYPGIAVRRGTVGQTGSA